MKLPRDVSGEKLVTRLARLGYQLQRQRGSHVTCVRQNDARHVIHIPLHSALKAGLLGAILKQVAQHLGLALEELLRQLEL